MAFGSTPEVDTPASTQRAAMTGAAKVQELAEDGYIGLERGAINESGRNHRRYLARAANTDVMAKSARPTYAPNSFDDQALGAAIGANSASVNAGKSAIDIIDKKRLMVANTGIGKAKSTADILGTTSGLATSRAVEDTKNEFLVKNSAASAAHDIGSMAAAAPGMKSDFDRWWKDTNYDKENPDADIKKAGMRDRYNYYMGGGV